MGFVWFNKDKLSVSSEGFIIENNSFICGKETVNLPLKKVNKVIFEEGLSEYKIILVVDGKILDTKYTFYIQNKSNYELLKSHISYLGKNELIFEENKTLLNRLLKGNKKKPISSY